MSTQRRRGPRDYRGPARSCEQCYGWGVLRGRICRGCESFHRQYPIGTCLTCRRPAVPVREGVCRLCRKQAALIAGPANKFAVDYSVAAVTGQQLFFADLPQSERTQRAKAAARPPRPVRTVPTPVIVPTPRAVWAQQLLLVDPPRDCRHASSLDPPRDPRLLDLLLRTAELLAEHQGWPPRTLQQVRRGLRMLASCHDPGEPVRASTATGMSSAGVPAVRVLDVLTAAGDGIVLQDRPDTLTVWIDAQFKDLPTKIRQELQVWIDVLRQGTPRRRARPRRTTFARLASIRPFLLETAVHYSTLRQVTPNDVTGWLDGRKHRANDASALRDLFRTLKSKRLVFTNPTDRVRVGKPNQTTPNRLTPETLQMIGRAAEWNPALRVVLALVGVHALGPRQLRLLRLEHLDLPNSRLDIGGATRTMDPFTADAISGYLTYRHTRWPRTSNPHLLVTRRTAHDQAAVSEFWLGSLLRHLPVTLRQLREDRILDEAHATDADPLHLSAMFGLGAQAGLRYTLAVDGETTQPGQEAEPTRPSVPIRRQSTPNHRQNS